MDTEQENTAGGAEQSVPAPETSTEATPEATPETSTETGEQAQ